MTLPLQLTKTIDHWEKSHVSPQGWALGSQNYFYDGALGGQDFGIQIFCP